MNALDRLITPQKRLPIRWDDDEWFQLAEQVLTERSKRPFTTMPQLVNLAQQTLIKTGKWSADRKRNITNNQEVKKLFPHLKLLDENREHAYRHREAVNAKLKELEGKQSKQSELDELTDEEVVVLFGKRVLEHISPAEIVADFTPQELLSMVPTAQIVGHAAQRLVEDLLTREINVRQHVVERAEAVSHGKWANGQAGRKPPSLPCVSVVGMKPDQYRRLEKHFEGRARLHFVDKKCLTSECIPEKTDIVVTWSNFTSSHQKKIIKHCCRNLQISVDQSPVHFGGYQGLVELIEHALADRTNSHLK